MRSPALLIFFFLTVSFAFGASKPVSSDGQQVDQAENPIVLRDAASMDNASLIRPESQDGACFKMRTYVMKREGIGDSTRLVKYYTCQKASKYGVKRAGENRDRDER